ncbi:MAG: DUF6702 family protein [Henriciella sp.]
MKPIIAFLSLAAASMTLPFCVAAAHEQAIGYSEITWVQDEGSDCSQSDCRLQIAHRVSIHDAESTLMSVLGARPDLVGDADAQVRFEAYVAERFALSETQDAAALNLTLLGGEVERAHYWVYQEIELDAPLQSLSIVQGVLMDAIPRQTNRVNIKRNEQVKTLVFSADPGPQTVSFD